MSMRTHGQIERDGNRPHAPLFLLSDFLIISRPFDYGLVLTIVFSVVVRSHRTAEV